MENTANNVEIMGNGARGRVAGAGGTTLQSAWFYSHFTVHLKLVWNDTECKPWLKNKIRTHTHKTQIPKVNSYWLLQSSPDYFAQCLNLGWCPTGIRRRGRKMGSWLENSCAWPGALCRAVEDQRDPLVLDPTPSLKLSLPLITWPSAFTCSRCSSHQSRMFGTEIPFPPTVILRIDEITLWKIAANIKWKYWLHNQSCCIGSKSPFISAFFSLFRFWDPGQHSF